MKNVKQSFSCWCFEKRGVDPLSLLHEAKKFGYEGVEFIPQVFWDEAVKAGLGIVNIAGHSPLEKGLNHLENHEYIKTEVTKQLEISAKYKTPYLTVFADNRNGINDAIGLANTVNALKQVIPEAEKLGVTLILELLNSKIDHPDHQCISTIWGVPVSQIIDSPNLKLLYDIYHMQVMEGDVIHTIQNHLDRIAHLHTAGVPGRHDIDGTQDLNYVAIIRTVMDSGYDGFVGHEFLPRGEPIAALKAAYQICNI